MSLEIFTWKLFWNTMRFWIGRVSSFSISHKFWCLRIHFAVLKFKDFYDILKPAWLRRWLKNPELAEKVRLNPCVNEDHTCFISNMSLLPGIVHIFFVQLYLASTRWKRVSDYFHASLENAPLLSCLLTTRSVFHFLYICLSIACLSLFP